jgi:hypothetical protein
VVLVPGFGLGVVLVVVAAERQVRWTVAVGAAGSWAAGAVVIEQAGLEALREPAADAASAGLVVAEAFDAAAVEVAARSAAQTGQAYHQACPGTVADHGETAVGGIAAEEDSLGSLEVGPAAALAE